MRVSHSPQPVHPGFDLNETARAFDTHARNYDAIVEPNAILRAMRAALQREVERRVPPGAALLDVGCGTGLDAAHFAQKGYRVTAIDPSREMVEQTRQRIARANLQNRVRVEHAGAQDIGRLDGQTFDAIYSDLGPLNCVSDLPAFARSCAWLVKPRGCLVFSVMGRYCPWEVLYYALRGQFRAARRRLTREMAPVKLESGIVWTRYYAPREFARFFTPGFRVVTRRGLGVFVPPPYLARWYERAGRAARPFAWLDARLTGLPFVRELGDHFLMTFAPSRNTGAAP